MNMLKEKQQKKVINKRKFLSEPNLPSEEGRVKNYDMFMVSPEDLKQTKKDVKKNENTVKKTKPVKKASKKLSAKELDEILKKPLSKTQTDKKPEEFQWQVKKNIIKLLDAAQQTGRKSSKTKQTTRNMQKNQAENVKREHVVVPKSKSVVEKTRKNPQRTQRQKSQQELLLKKTNTLNLPRQTKIYPQERPTTSAIDYHASFITRPPTTFLRPISNPPKKNDITKFKKLFNVFKYGEVAIPKTEKNKKLEQLMKEGRKEKIQMKKPEKIAKMNDKSSVIKSTPKPKNKERDEPEQRLKTPKRDEPGQRIRTPKREEPGQRLKTPKRDELGQRIRTPKQDELGPRVKTPKRPGSKMLYS